MHGARQPNPGKLPIAPHRLDRDPHHFGGLLHAQPAEKAQFDGLGLAGIFGCEGIERVVERDDLAIAPGAAKYSSTKEVFPAGPPRLNAPLVRAASTRIRRIICAASAKNWLRLRKFRPCASARRR